MKFLAQEKGESWSGRVAVHSAMARGNETDWDRTRSPPRSPPLEPLGECERCGTGLDHRILRLSGRWLSAVTGEQQTVCRWCFFLGDLANLRTRLGPGAAEQAFDADLEILWRTTRDNVTLGRGDRAYGDRGSSSQFSPH